MSYETWEDIHGYEGLYQVSDAGRVRSVSRKYKRILPSGIEIEQRLTGRILKPNLNTHGYRYVILRRDGRSETREIHKLVAITFLPKPELLQTQVRHLDGNRLNNVNTNLVWGTPSENQLDLYRYRGYHHRLTPEDVKEIRAELERGVKGRELAKRFNISESNISEIKHGRSFAWLK